MSMFTSSPKNVGANVPHHPEYETFVVTPSDTVDLPLGSGNNRRCRAIMVLAAGNVAVNLDGTATPGTAILTGLVAGDRVTVGVARVLATGTTVAAGSVLALF